jgi:hypothetical protein
VGDGEPSVLVTRGWEDLVSHTTIIEFEEAKVRAP